MSADPVTGEGYTLSLHDALPISGIAVLMGLRLDAPRHGVRLHLTGQGNRALCRPLQVLGLEAAVDLQPDAEDRKSTRLNSSHMSISYAVFCLKKKNTGPIRLLL